MDRLTTMAVFVKAVDLGSFSAAAAALEMSGPMVGKHVRSLEERLGVRLINRTTRRQSLTEVGRAYYERCRIVLAEAQAADALAEDQHSEPAGRLRVTMPVLLGRRCVVPILLEVARQYPRLQLEMSLNDRVGNLADGGFDLAIRTGDLADDAELIARRVARQRMFVYAAPSFLGARGTPASVDDLGQFDAVIYSRSGRARPWLFPRDAQPPTEVFPVGRLRLDDLDAIADVAAAGMGLAWLPSWLVREQVATGALTPLLADQPGFPYDVHAVWLRTPHLPRKVRVIVDALAALLPQRVEYPA